ncbi:hypothetical protein pipiens_018892 [Culex pipiens pipiens]|uniref:Uncharacterized protein n=1 Tax=Culex pipiens pipiens TaxID=38569 RepID=A0ABD1E1X1_CULPP
MADFCGDIRVLWLSLSGVQCKILISSCDERFLAAVTELGGTGFFLVSSSRIFFNRSSLSIPYCSLFSEVFSSASPHSGYA